MNTNSRERISIYIVDDHPSTREGLKRAIDLQDDMTVCGESGTYADAANALATLRPDILVLDLNLPDGNGWTLLEQFHAANGLPPTLVLSVCDENLYARRLLRAGARGYLMKDEPTERILDAVRAIRSGRRVAGDTILNRLIAEALGLDAERAEEQTQREMSGSLTNREIQIFALLATDLSNKEIAIHLGLSEKTVSTHKINLMKKLGVRSATKLAERYRALQLGAVFDYRSTDQP
jgi:DNA-binding NarL/FixJ family response regulator